MKDSRQVLLEKIAFLEKRDTLFLMYVHDLLNEVPTDAVAVEHDSVSGNEIVFELRRATAAHGGYVAMLQTLNGKREPSLVYLSELTKVSRVAILQKAWAKLNEAQLKIACRGMSESTGNVGS